VDKQVLPGRQAERGLGRRGAATLLDAIRDVAGPEATILLLVVGYFTFTWPNTAEKVGYQCFTVSSGTRATQQFTDIVLDDSDFFLKTATSI
jgi:hypothetical protein